MHYHITVADPASHFLNLTFTVSKVDQEYLELQLPAWRPGRYEIQNFAKNIQNIAAFSHQGDKLSIEKIGKDRWRVATRGQQEVRIAYNYYANILNAGTSYVDAELWYLNFINFALYVDGRMTEPYRISLDIPTAYQVATGLKMEGPELFAPDFYTLVDSPVLASATIQVGTYQLEGVDFSVWMQGKQKPNWERILDQFSRFSAEQLATMGTFPEKDYHFMNLILPTAYYHGVEHRNSTMVVLGPDDEGEEFYADLLGVSSHELFHAWNIIRIRPVELLPYDFTRENYFQTCFVAEGCTTYYGDLFLVRAGVFDLQAYIKELEVYMKRHFENSGNASQSLLESSYDLWLDGYEKGIPDRKVSVYHKGALVALILDLYLRKHSNHSRSLDDVMRILWERFGKPFIGYSLQDYQQVVEEVAGEPLDWYWERCIRGTEPLEGLLNEALKLVGLQMLVLENGQISLSLQADEGSAQHLSRWLSSRQPASQGEMGAGAL
ncbi:putative metalloprotease with PDZ domain [Dyadobacter jejuensis]|uniref:Putative metalloprotease with PDZ domain n=1 Tax=Dyadobacter jejuensis TaxID=1082580 RepID=A0A316AQS4_9BACT|nr:M61 family metallopeptidase [Dyadobacter jejuensis]PWJ60073.1 putative metalloprotease with PDZ domain [Dyadobacter jejuensis]